MKENLKENERIDDLQYKELETFKNFKGLDVMSGLFVLE